MDHLQGPETHPGLHEHSSATAVAEPLRCSICARKLGKTVHFIEETSETPEPRQSWMLCDDCDDAVHDQIERAPLRSPMRVRVAVGLVAADRTPAARRARFGQLSDPVWERVIFWGFAGALIVHLIVMIFVASLVSASH
jgi:hypothetical protein